MPSISDYAQEMPVSPMRMLSSYADEAKRKGKKIYHLNIGQPDIPTPAVFMEAVKATSPEIISYQPSRGMGPLRTSISNYFQRLGYDIHAQHILITTGASEAVDFVFSAVADPEDEIIVPEPYYGNYSTYAGHAHIKMVPITTSIEDNFALPPISKIEEAITPRTKAILFCNPNNPTGTFYSKETLLKLQELVLKHDLYLIVDEVYREFVYGEEKNLSVLGLNALHDHAIVIDSVSKRFSACGARIGCMISRNEQVVSAVLKMCQARLASPMIDQIGAEALYRLPLTYFNDIVATYTRRRNALVDCLQKIEGILCPPINGAFYAMIRVPIPDTDHFCKWLLTDFEYNGASIMLAPGSGFYTTPGLGLDEVRIAYILNEEDLKISMEILEKAIEAYPFKKVSSPDSSQSKIKI